MYDEHVFAFKYDYIQKETATLKYIIYYRLSKMHSYRDPTLQVSMIIKHGDS